MPQGWRKQVFYCKPAAVFFADDTNRGYLRSVWHQPYDIIYCDKLVEVADQFDRTHSVHRAQ